MGLLVSNEQNVLPVTPELEALFKRIIEAVLRAEGEGEEAEVSLVLTDDGYIRELNRHYRFIDSPTDVLSFALREQAEGETEYQLNKDEWLLGDIVISLETARRQAREFGHSLERELGFLIIHGCLHLLGFDHETAEEREKMRQKEEGILTILDLTR